MKAILVFTAVICGFTSFPARAADPAKVMTKDDILSGLKKPALTRSMGKTRSIGVAEKPQITTHAILFKFGTTDIEGELSLAQINELGKALEDPTMKNASIEIQGHTDNVGGEEANKKLSEARAQKVVQELQQHYTLAVKQVIPVGKGKAEPVAGTKEQQTDAERALNRRVVVRRVDQQP